jgi:transposase
LVFLAETGLNTIRARPHGHWPTAPFIAALRHHRLHAPFWVEGPMDGEAFPAYWEHVLCPQRRSGDTLILDNLSPHKVPRVARWLSACGARLRYLPPYSPDLNPRAQAIAKRKAHLRQAAARTVEALLIAGGDALDPFSASHGQAFLRHAHMPLFK